jgi:hypothetical protein
VLTFSGGDHLYSDRDRISSDATAAHLAVWGSNLDQEEQALDTLRDLGITHVLFDQSKIESGEISSLAIANESNLSAWYEVEYEDQRYFLARLLWEELTPVETE